MAMTEIWVWQLLYKRRDWAHHRIIIQYLGWEHTSKLNTWTLEHDAVPLHAHIQLHTSPFWLNNKYTGDSSQNWHLVTFNCTLLSWAVISPCQRELYPNVKLHLSIRHTMMLLTWFSSYNLLHFPLIYALTVHPIICFSFYLCIRFYSFGLTCCLLIKTVCW